MGEHAGLLRSVQGYHLLAAALFAPVLVLQPRLLALALGVALLVMVAAEVVRLGRVPVLSALLVDRKIQSTTSRYDFASNFTFRAIAGVLDTCFFMFIRMELAQRSTGRLGSCFSASSSINILLVASAQSEIFSRLCFAPPMPAGPTRDLVQHSPRSCNRASARRGS